MTRINKFLEFINLFHLNGLNEVALMSFDGKQSEVKFYVQEHAFFGHVKYKDSIIDKECELPVFQCDILKKILKSYEKLKEEDVNLEVKYKGESMLYDEPHSISIQSKDIKSNFILADRKIIRNQRSVDKDKIEWDYSVKLDETFIERFFSYNNILKDHEFFSFSAEDFIKIHFGNVKKSFENSISINIAINDQGIKKPYTFFNLEYFSNVLKINEDAKDITLKINKKMYCLEITTDTYECIYINASKK